MRLGSSFVTSNCTGSLHVGIEAVNMSSVHAFANSSMTWCTLRYLRLCTDHWKKYLIEPCEDCIDPLQYRKEHSKKFSVLAKLAKMYLAVPATPASVEQLFSIVENLFKT
ncbi:hypothetical protein KUTeg_019355 [Tegillarca granosa]|uniref:HAT C-terminal dimerisation domain-containing protein n=1 Tax=Tegillarca granosa TaxID=220873 RepID=A0ABQ9EC98_TEGGR|nr:hypothetical protein KUTeg_019355 [Tegillarca granosa]